MQTRLPPIILEEISGETESQNRRELSMIDGRLKQGDEIMGGIREG